jgi:PPOX class probable F420-dependent enzyme
MALDPDAHRLAKGKNLATVVTLMPSGQPQAQLTWIDADDDHVLVNTEPQRQRSRNVARDPKITVLIHSDDPWDWAEVRGRVVAWSTPSAVSGPATTSTSCPTVTSARTTRTRSARPAASSWSSSPTR